MTTIFDGYDEEYRTLTSDISKKLSEIASYEDQKDKKKASIVHVGDLLTQATQLIQQMELEVRSLDAATRRELSKKVDQYKKSLASLSADHKKIREKEEREGLFGDRDGNAASAEHRVAWQQLPTSMPVKMMKGTTDKLAAARKEIADTEEVALAIGEELGRNREKIEATHTKVKGVNEMARRGGNIVGRMSARDKRQRMALSIAAGFIIIAILLLIYFGIFKKK
ncbi:t-SNARE [Phytophthora cactorum]|nr:t-SNARE [Phytophthora cactorum]KAF1787482.1 t-SNARE [Phytophthora cactorum]